MFHDDESTEERPDNFRRNQDGSFDGGDSDDPNSGKGCLEVMAVILIPVGYLPAPALPAVSIRP